MVQIQNNFTELFLMMPSIKIAQLVPLHGTKAARALDKKCLLMAFPPEPLV